MINECPESNIRNKYIKKIIEITTNSLQELNNNCLKNKEKEINKYYNPMKRIIIFLYIIIFNIENFESWKFIFEINDQILLNVLKKLLINHSKSETLLPEIIMSLCFHDFKKKCIDNPILGNQDKNNAHFYLKIFNILFTEYPKPSIIYLSNNSDSFIQNLNQFNTEFIEKLDPHKIIEIYEGIIFLVFQNDDFDIYNFFDNLVKNHIQTTKYYNSELSSLFRKDDIYHLILKNFVFSFCNYSFIESVYKQLKNDYLKNFEKEFNINIFEKFFETFINLIFETIPGIIKVIMKIIYENINREYVIEQNNYSPIYTFLIFDFYISPKIFEIYELSFSTYSSIKLLNRVMRNIFYNKQFNKNDSLNSFNSIIEKYNNIINFKIKSILDSIKIDNRTEINKIIKFTLSNINFPLFLKSYSSININMITFNNKNN